MTIMMTEEARHSTDGELVRLLDDEVGPGDADVATHLKTCAVCRSRLETLRRRSTLLSEALAAADLGAVDTARLRPQFERLRAGSARHRARRSAWSSVALRAAAAVLLLTGVAAATPARAWILERVARLRGAAVKGERPAPAQAPTPRPAAEPSSAVFFTPASEVLVIRLEARQATGTLEVIAGPEPRSSAQLVGAAAEEAFLVLPSELRIRNTSRSVASYRVVLSAGIRQVRVVTGGGTSAQEVVFDAGPQTRRMITLGPARPAAP
jgi:hypothetical protein